MVQPSVRMVGQLVASTIVVVSRDFPSSSYLLFSPAFVFVLLLARLWTPFEEVCEQSAAEAALGVAYADRRLGGLSRQETQ